MTQATWTCSALTIFVVLVFGPARPGLAAENESLRESAIRNSGPSEYRKSPTAPNSSVVLPTPVAPSDDLRSERLLAPAWVASRHPAATVGPNDSNDDVVPPVTASVSTAVDIKSDTGSAPVAVSEPDHAALTAAPELSPPEKSELFVLVLVGDTGLNAHNQRVRPKNAIRHGRGYAWDWTTEKIAPLIDGHVNFANIETVVTARNTLRASPKTFNFRMHPNGARHLVDVGFNLFSLANNHSADYGREGVRETLREARKLRTAGLRGFAGLGVDRETAVQPDTFTVGQARFGFAAMGIGARSDGPARAGFNKPGQVNIYGKADFNDVVDNLVDAPADYRILSMHFGAERNVRPLPGQVKKWRDDVLIGRDIDLIVGHHAHVVQGVQMTDGKLIFYGMGNFLHMGMQDMSKFNACRDYGLLARVFVVRQPDGTMQAQAVQVVPLTDMHLRARAMTGKSAARRIDVLNMLAEELDDDLAGSSGVRFAKQLDGSGLFCRPGAENGPGRLGALCQGYAPAPAFSARERRRVRGLCGAVSRAVAGTSSRGRKKARRSSQKRKVWTGGSVFQRRN